MGLKPVFNEEGECKYMHLTLTIPRYKWELENAQVKVKELKSLRLPAHWHFGANI